MSSVLGPAPKWVNPLTGAWHGERCPCLCCSEAMEWKDRVHEHTMETLLNTVTLPAWAQTARVIEAMDAAASAEAAKRVLSRAEGEV